MPLSIICQKDIYLPAPTFHDEAAPGAIDPQPFGLLGCRLPESHPCPTPSPTQRVEEPRGGMLQCGALCTQLHLES